jgi:glycerol-3-phosphate dehydrogenase
MAEETVDLIAQRLQSRGQTVERCNTQQLRLSGWQADDDVAEVISGYRQQARDMGLPEDTACYLPTVYGKHTDKVLQLAKSGELSCKLSPQHPYIAAQVVYAARYEAALSIDDVLSRRLRLTITDRRAAFEAAALTASLLAKELHWSKNQLKNLLQQFRDDLTASNR